MTEPTLLDLMGDEGPVKPDLVDDGQDWGASAFHALRTFAKTTPLFKSEYVRRYAHERGLPIPPDGRAWGAVFLKAQKEELIARVGFGRSTNRVAHSRPATVWQAK